MESITDYCNTGLPASESTYAVIDQSVPQRCVFSGHAVVFLHHSPSVLFLRLLSLRLFITSRSVPVAPAGRVLCILYQLPPLDTAPR